MKDPLKVSCLCLVLSANTLKFVAAQEFPIRIVLKQDEIIPTNTVVFQDYVLKGLLPVASLVASQWNLGTHLPIKSNQLTGVLARPRPDGPSGSIQIDGRYGFGVGRGGFSLFRDLELWSRPFAYSEKRMKELVKVPNLLTLESAVALAKDRIHRLGIDEIRLGLGEPFHARQWKFESNGVVYPLPIYEVGWRRATGDFFVIEMEISGVTSNVANFYHTIPAKLLPSTLQVPTPTNYLQMLGLPTNVIFLPHDWEQRQRLLRESQAEPPPVLQ